jgi:hypothetical protein
MKAVTRQWADKAEADYAAALLLRRSRKKHSRGIEAGIDMVNPRV